MQFDRIFDIVVANMHVISVSIYVRDKDIYDSLVHACMSCIEFPDIGDQIREILQLEYIHISMYLCNHISLSL